MLVAIKTFQIHPKIFNIKQAEFNSIFSFKNTNEKEKIMKFKIDLFSSFICQHFNYCISKDEFSNECKDADVIPVHKNGINVIKLTIGRTFQKFMRAIFIINFMNTLMINFYLVNVHILRDIVLNSLLVMSKKFKESVDKGNAIGALLTDLSKAFDCIDHTLLIAKLFAFGVSPLSLKLTYSYLSNRTHRIKINKDFSDRTDIEFGVPRGFVLGPLLFNFDMIHVFMCNKIRG